MIYLFISIFIISTITALYCDNVLMLTRDKKQCKQYRLFIVIFVSLSLASGVVASWLVLVDSY